MPRFLYLTLRLLFMVYLHQKILDNCKNSLIIDVHVSERLCDDCQSLRIVFLCISDCDPNQALQALMCRLVQLSHKMSECTESIGHIKFFHFIMIFDDDLGELVEEGSIIVVESLQIPKVPASHLHWQSGLLH